MFTAPFSRHRFLTRNRPESRPRSASHRPRHPPHSSTIPRMSRPRTRELGRHRQTRRFSSLPLLGMCLGPSSRPPPPGRDALASKSGARSLLRKTGRPDEPSLGVSCTRRSHCASRWWLMVENRYSSQMSTFRSSPGTARLRRIRRSSSSTKSALTTALSDGQLD